MLTPLLGVIEVVSLYINPVIIETNCLNDLLESSAQGLTLFANLLSGQGPSKVDMAYAVDPQKLLDIEEDLDWMKAGLDLVNSRFVTLMFWRKPMQ
jgi:hypothetical protein